MNTKTKTLAAAALMAALACIATMAIKIPSPFKGYLNAGDCIVLMAGWMLPPAYGFMAAGLGSALADVFSGYAVYAPATFAIKGIMAVLSFCIFHLLHKKAGDLPARIIGGAAAEAVMVSGYFLFEGLLYGFAPSVVNIPANGVQGAFGLAAGLALMKILKKSKITLD